MTNMNPFKGNLEYASNDLYIMNNNNTSNANQDSITNLNNTEINNPLNLQNSKFSCAICQKPTLMCCSDCKATFYCGLYHQKLHWKTHQNECFKQQQQEDNLNVNALKPSEALLQPSNKSFGPNKLEEFVDPIEKSNILKEVNKQSYMDNNKSIQDYIDQRSITEKSVNHEELNIDLLNEERRKLLKEAFILYSQNHLNQSIIKARKIVKTSYEIYNNTNQSNYYEHIVDYLFLVKCLLKADQYQNARQELILASKLAIEHISDNRIDYRKGRENINGGYNYPIILNKEFISFINDETITIKVKNDIVAKLKKITNLYSTIANLFYVLGDFNNCEAFYVKYVKVIENNYGNESHEASNCYYLIGVFYLQHKYYLKSMACFKKALSIRLTKFEDENHDSIADCYYNIAIIYKQCEDTYKAVTTANKALKIRASLIGEISLPVAQVLELLGKIYMETFDYKSSFEKLLDCWNMRKKILQNIKHKDIKRVTLLIYDLNNEILKAIINPKTSTKQRELLVSLNQRIMNSNIINHLPQSVLFNQAQQVLDKRYNTTTSFNTTTGYGIGGGSSSSNGGGGIVNANNNSNQMANNSTLKSYGKRNNSSGVENVNVNDNSYSEYESSVLNYGLQQSFRTNQYNSKKPNNNNHEGNNQKLINQNSISPIDTKRSQNSQFENQLTYNSNSTTSFISNQNGNMMNSTLETMPIMSNNNMGSISDPMPNNNNNNAIASGNINNQNTIGNIAKSSVNTNNNSMVQDKKVGSNNNIPSDEPVSNTNFTILNDSQDNLGNMSFTDNQNISFDTSQFNGTGTHDKPNPFLNLNSSLVVNQNSIGSPIEESKNGPDTKKLNKNPNAIGMFNSGNSGNSGHSLFSLGPINQADNANNMNNPKNRNSIQSNQHGGIATTSNESDVQSFGSGNSNRRDNAYQLNVNSSFITSLNTDQLLKLAELKCLITKNKGNDIENTIINSEFYRSLNKTQANTFIIANQHLMKNIYAKNLQENLKNQTNLKEDTNSLKGANAHSKTASMRSSDYDVYDYESGQKSFIHEDSEKDYYRS